MDKTQDLINLFQEMAEMTLPKCQACPLPMSCCSPEYCEMAIVYAKEKWNVGLERTGDPKLPLMGPEGCTAAPHLRPLCTLHTCQINAIACDPKDPEWTKRYFALREKINELYELFYADLLKNY